MEDLQIMDGAIVQIMPVVAQSVGKNTNFKLSSIAFVFPTELNFGFVVSPEGTIRLDLHCHVAHGGVIRKKTSLKDVAANVDYLEVTP